MKAVIDSKEFEIRVKIANYFSSRRIVASFTNAALLEVVDGWLFIRTSTGERHSLQAVNAFDTEPGAVVTGISALMAAVFDTGEMVSISTDKKLRIKSGSYEANLDLLNTAPTDFPVMFETNEIVAIPDRLIKAAVRHTQPIEKSYDPIRSSVYIVPDHDILYIVGVDGTVGFLTQIPGNIEDIIAIDASALESSISGLAGGMVKIGLSDNGNIVSLSGDGPSRVNFTSSTAKWSDSIIGFFKMEADYSFDMTLSDANKLKRLCMAALGADENAVMIIYSSGEQAIVEVHGNSVMFQDTIAAPKIPCGTFTCKMLNRAIGALMDAEKYNVQVLDRSSNMKFWRWHYDNNIHFVGMANSPLISSRLDELKINVNT